MVDPMEVITPKLNRPVRHTTRNTQSRYSMMVASEEINFKETAYATREVPPKIPHIMAM